RPIRMADLLMALRKPARADRPVDCVLAAVETALFVRIATSSRRVRPGFTRRPSPWTRAAGESSTTRSTLPFRARSPRSTGQALAPARHRAPALAHALAGPPRPRPLGRLPGAGLADARVARAPIPGDRRRLHGGHRREPHRDRAPRTLRRDRRARGTARPFLFPLLPGEPPPGRLLLHGGARGDPRRVPRRSTGPGGAPKPPLHGGRAGEVRGRSPGEAAALRPLDLREERGHLRSGHLPRPLRGPRLRLRQSPLRHPRRPSPGAARRGSGGFLLLFLAA